MPKAPTTFHETRHATRTDREALTLTAVLPNLPNDERIIDLRGYCKHGYLTTCDEDDARTFDTDTQTLARFRKHNVPIAPGTSLYRVRIDDDQSDDYDIIVDPVPHGRRSYMFKRYDVVEFVPVDAEDYDFDDDPYARLSDFGFGSPYLNPWYANRDAFDREPHLPV